VLQLLEYISFGLKKISGHRSSKTSGSSGDGGSGAACRWPPPYAQGCGSGSPYEGYHMLSTTAYVVHYAVFWFYLDLEEQQHCLQDPRWCHAVRRHLSGGVQVFCDGRFCQMCAMHACLAFFSPTASACICGPLRAFLWATAIVAPQGFTHFRPHCLKLLRTKAHIVIKAAAAAEASPRCMPLAAWRQAVRYQWCCGGASARLRLRVRPGAAAGQLRVMSKRGETEEERKARKEAVKVRAAPACPAG
jgi:hypothetical protein